jgi:hypothetical protein
MISLFAAGFFSVLPTSLDCCRRGPPQLCCQDAWQFEGAPYDTARHCQSHPSPDTQHPHCLQEILSLVILNITTSCKKLQRNCENRFFL